METKGRCFPNQSLERGTENIHYKPYVITCCPDTNMAEEIVYADLNIPEHPHPHSQGFSVHLNSSLQHSRWLLVALCIGNVILVVAVIALALQLEAEKRKPGTGGQIPSDSVENFQLHLRSKLCNQTQDSISGSLACHLCPADWHLHKDKCYWPSEDLKFWNQSRDYCFTRGSQLAVIQSQEELGFIQKLLSDQRYWIGLEWSGTKWTWITGSQLDPNM
ncbi:Killer cell lectin-like receptor subfamily B member 1B allele B [Varanus komodoensis]|nr:Killer cell lectin-like receptor subfamily B member 1B allele B [Varanus komodoensis]